MPFSITFCRLISFSPLPLGYCSVSISRQLTAQSPTMAPHATPMRRAAPALVVLLLLAAYVSSARAV